MKLSTIVMAMIVGFTLSAGLADAVERMPSNAAGKTAIEKKATSVRIASGEVVSVTPGKKFQIKEQGGKLRTYYVSKKTTISGHLKVGEHVSVTSAGRWAREVNVKSALATR